MIDSRPGLRKGADHAITAKLVSEKCGWFMGRFAVTARLLRGGHRQD
jgi:hypothetical protein